MFKILGLGTVWGPYYSFNIFFFPVLKTWIPSTLVFVSQNMAFIPRNMNPKFCLVITLNSLHLITRAVVSLSLPDGQDKNISSIFPHFPVVSLIFPWIFFIFFLILVFRVGESTITNT